MPKVSLYLSMELMATTFSNDAVSSGSSSDFGSSEDEDAGLADVRSILINQPAVKGGRN